MSYLKSLVAIVLALKTSYRLIAAIKMLQATFVIDTSMAPTSKPNDILIAEITTTPTPGSYVIVILKDQPKPIIRKYRDVGAEGIQLIPDNDDWAVLALPCIDKCLFCAVIIEHRHYFSNAT